ncbi:ArgE/DapE family deacylase [Natrarchaeobius chitinivorans]|uniref:Probable succinyl-diaminopimelate desuccinylase n=1 Tax=Natrarchaeobius chitinivorans TaxID=1679083 RepID=A0A3N6P9A7_NATCH|nr:ArgE/DapE family deacylase [Natrarchaeobius chitinivorans]RQG95459.1 ArgE/DapE family deacylase [Natrarchaeobius chitinivorans]
MTVSNQTVQAVDTEIERLEESMIQFLSTLVEKRTVTGNERAGQEVMANKFESLGAAVDRWEPNPERLRGHSGYFETSTFEEVGYGGRPNVGARLDGVGEGNSLGLSGHIDVVSVTEREWDSDPWTLVRDDDRLIGRGSCDMKGGIAAYVTAVEALQAANVDLEGDLVLQSTIEEEAGGVGGVLSALERGYRPDAAVIPEPLDIPHIGTASAGVMYFRITVPGRTAHAGRAYAGVNALDKAVLLLQSLNDLDETRKGRIDYPRAYRADRRLEGHVTNLNIGVIDGGEWPSTVPGEVTLEGRIGWPPGETREQVRKEIRRTISNVATRDEWLAEHPPELSWFGWQAEPHEVPLDSRIARVSKTAAEDVTGNEGQFVGGHAGMDERFYKNYYDINAVSVGPYGENLHGPNEHTTVTSLTDTAKTLARIIMYYCGVASD